MTIRDSADWWTPEQKPARTFTLEGDMAVKCVLAVGPADETGLEVRAVECGDTLTLKPNERAERLIILSPAYHTIELASDADHPNIRVQLKQGRIAPGECAVCNTVVSRPKCAWWTKFIGRRFVSRLIARCTTCGVMDQIE